MVPENKDSTACLPGPRSEATRGRKWRRRKAGGTLCGLMRVPGMEGTRIRPRIFTFRASRRVARRAPPPPPRAPARRTDTGRAGRNRRRTRYSRALRAAPCASRAGRARRPAARTRALGRGSGPGCQMRTAAVLPWQAEDCQRPTSGTAQLQAPGGPPQVLPRGPGAAVLAGRRRGAADRPGARRQMGCAGPRRPDLPCPWRAAGNGGSRRLGPSRLCASPAAEGRPARGASG